MRVIEDSLDNQVDETEYHLPEIRKLLNHIEEDEITPQDRARMIEESYIGEAEKRGIEQGLEEGKIKEKLAIAIKMKVKGYDVAEIMELSGLNEETMEKL